METSLLRIFIDVLKIIFMKQYLMLLLSAVLFFSAAMIKSDNTLHTDGVYMGKIEITQERGSITEYHYIAFKADGKANTYILNSPDIDKVSALLKNNTIGDFSGEYRIYGNEITYRSNNSIGKTEKPAKPMATFYKGKINENGSLSLEATFEGNTKSSATFEFQSLK